MSDEKFPKMQRLLNPADFGRVRKARQSTRDDAIRVSACKNNLEFTRLGLVVSKRIGNAVCRNLWKRRLREAFRLSKGKLPAGLDLVVIPVTSDPPTSTDLQLSLRKLANRLAKRLLNE